MKIPKCCKNCANKYRAACCCSLPAQCREWVEDDIGFDDKTITVTFNPDDTLVEQNEFKKMEKDYKKMWDTLREYIQNTKSEHENDKDDFAALGKMLAGMMMKAFDVVLEQMEWLEYGTAHCVICGAELKEGEEAVCDECKSENEELADDSLLGRLLYKNKDNS